MSLLKENISFVVVCYKSSTALKSLLISIPKELEVVLVDNSNDKETSEIANSYDAQDMMPLAHETLRVSLNILRNLRSLR